MTPREKNLLIVLSIVFALVSLLFTGGYYLEKHQSVALEITKQERLLLARQQALREIQSYEQVLGEGNLSMGNPVSTQSRAINEEIAFIKAELQSQGIKPDRLAISGKEGSETIDFFLKTNPMAILRFFKGNPRPGMGYRYDTITMKQTREPSVIETHIRILHESIADTP